MSETRQWREKKRATNLFITWILLLVPRVFQGKASFQKSLDEQFNLMK